MNNNYSLNDLNPPPLLKERYELTGRLGAGGMGVVYRAHDMALNRDVAIKFLAPNQLVRDDMSVRFLREAQVIARLSHPNIMTIYDVGHEGTWHYLVLEYVAGRDLLTAMTEAGGILPISDSLRIIRGVLEGLAYAHEQGIVHRDIKPQNIMLTADGAVKVTDFGLALTEGDMRLTKEGVVVGTLLYLPPEAVMGLEIDHQADLYAVGAVLYELLTGRPPYTGASATVILSKILSAPLILPRTISGHIPADTEQIVLKLLAKDRALRYESAKAVLVDLAKLLPLFGPHDSQTLDSSANAADSLFYSLTDRVSLITISKVTPDSAGPEKIDLDLGETSEADDPARVSHELLVYGALEDTAAAVEFERRRLADLLEKAVIEPITLLLSQAGLYEQTLGANPQAKMAASVLASLARQAIQQTRDLRTNLYPTLLETLGLELALESLVGQTICAYGVQINLNLTRLAERLPAPVELAFFRATQDAIDRAIQEAHASQIDLTLTRRDNEVAVNIADNGSTAVGSDSLRAARQRVKQVGGKVETRIGTVGGLELILRFTPPLPVQLTDREREVLQLVASGLSNKEIAQRLSLSPRTINFHLDNIYSKLAVRSRTEAAMYAVRRGWIQRPSTDPG